MLTFEGKSRLAQRKVVPGKLIKKQSALNRPKSAQTGKGRGKVRAFVVVKGRNQK